MQGDTKITVYGRATSSNVQAVMWEVGELGLAYERLDYGHVHGGLDSAEFRALNPHGKVPVIADGGLSVFESGAILRYLAARYGQAPFWPDDPLARAQIDQWAEWGKTNFSRAFTVPIFWSRVRTAAADRDQAALNRAVEHFEACLDMLDTQLAKMSHVASDDFTLADIVIGHVLFRWFDIDVPRRPRPLTESYYERLKSRPAYQEHVMLPYDILRVPGA